jgi:hypothetical protein
MFHLGFPEIFMMLLSFAFYLAVIVGVARLILIPVNRKLDRLIELMEAERAR